MFSRISQYHCLTYSGEPGKSKCPIFNCLAESVFYEFSNGAANAICESNSTHSLNRPPQPSSLCAKVPSRWFIIIFIYWFSSSCSRPRAVAAGKTHLRLRLEPRGPRRAMVRGGSRGDRSPTDRGEPARRQLPPRRHARALLRQASASATPVPARDPRDARAKAHRGGARYRGALLRRPHLVADVARPRRRASCSITSWWTLRRPATARRSSTSPPCSRPCARAVSSRWRRSA